MGRRAGDRTARIWDLSSSTTAASKELHHPLKKEKDVTTLDWHPDGAVLATGAYDGVSRIWSREGTLSLRSDFLGNPWSS